MKFEDVQMSFYQSAMNSSESPVPARVQERKQMAYQQPVNQAPYNPFDEFTQNDFVQPNFEADFR